MQTYISLDQLDDNPFQRRVEYGDLEDLAARIHAKRRDYPDTYGLMQLPLGRIVRHESLLSATAEPLSRGQAEQLLRDHGGLPGGNLYRVQLAFGHRRLRAFHILAERYPNQYGQAMPVNILQLSDEQMLDSVWSENRERRDLSAVEEAELLAEKLERARSEGGNQQTVAEAWGLSRPTVANRLRLLDLPVEVQQANRDGRLSERQALALLPVFELDAKLNGSPVQWGDTGGPTWHPRSPAGYVALVLTEPEKATSDAIRAYTQNAVAHAGRPLGDAFAAFEADQGRAIVQPACNGCPRRVNQHCLNTACYDARAKRFLAVLPEWASRETGLPFSDKAADETDYTHTYDEREALRADWKAGRHEGMVVGIQNDYYNLRPYTDKGYISEEAMMQDWRLALILGRKPATAPVAPGVDGATALVLPADDELASWRRGQTKANRERAGRVKDALRSRVALLAENEIALWALAALLTGYELRQLRERGEGVTAEQLVDVLFDYGWRRTDTVGHDYNDDGSNRTKLQDLLHTAAINPVVVDPPDPTLRLIDVGQLALLTYDKTRRRVGTKEPYERAKRLRDALAEFEAAPAVVAGNDELATLERYLRAALEVEEAKLPKEA